MRNISFSGPEGAAAAAAAGAGATTKTTARTPTLRERNGGSRWGCRVGGWLVAGGFSGWLSGAALNIGNRTENGAYSVLLRLCPLLPSFFSSRSAKRKAAKETAAAGSNNNSNETFGP